MTQARVRRLLAVVLTVFLLAAALAGCDDWGTTTGPSPTPPSGQAGTLRVSYIDVGQGDSILIQTPEGRTILIDGGEENGKALAYLQSQGIARLDLMVATHPHADHIGGLTQILAAMPVVEVVTNGQSNPTPGFGRFLDAIANARAAYREVQRGDTLAIDATTLDVLHPGANAQAASPGSPSEEQYAPSLEGPPDQSSSASRASNPNNYAIALRMTYGPTTFLFMSDVEAGGEDSMLASGQNLRATVLKVGHHGSETATSAPLLAAVRPKVAVYSAGAGNSFHHPSATTIAALKAAGVDVYGTDVQGTIVITATPLGYQVNTIPAPDLVPAALRCGRGGIS
jgi:competence protein ComEC